MATQTKTNGSKSADFGIQVVADTVVDVVRTAGEYSLDTVETAGERVAELQRGIGEASQVELIATLGETQAGFTSDVVKTYVSAGRKLIA